LVPLSISRRIHDHLTSMEEMRNLLKMLVGKSERKRPLGRPRRRWDDIRMDLSKCVERVWAGFMWLSIGTSGGSFEQYNEPSTSIKGRNFPD